MVKKLLQMIYAEHLYRLTQENFLVLLCLINVNYFNFFDVFYNQLIVELKGMVLGVAYNPLLLQKPRSALTFFYPNISKFRWVGWGGGGGGGALLLYETLRGGRRGLESEKMRALHM